MSIPNPEQKKSFPCPREMQFPTQTGNARFKRVFDSPFCKMSYLTGTNLAVFVEDSVFRDIAKHAESDERNEIGGALLGWYCRDSQVNRDFVVVMKTYRADPKINENFVSPTRMRFTHSFFLKLDDILDILLKDDPYLLRLGMYHSHPGYGVFMSATDTETFCGVFKDPWHISLIIDPLNKDAGVFVWTEPCKKVSSKLGFSLFIFSDMQGQSELSGQGKLSESPPEDKNIDLGPI